jgi:hypothetical protein
METVFNGSIIYKTVATLGGIVSDYIKPARELKLMLEEITKTVPISL